MAKDPHKPGVVLLGASGRLGRMVRHLWDSSPLRAFRCVPVTRQGLGCGEATVWQPGAPVPDLPGIVAVLALWGVTKGSESALAQNARLAEQALDMARRLGAGCVVHCSSGAVYAGLEGDLHETRALYPTGAYGVAKLRMEAGIADWHARNGAATRSVILRIGNVAGADSLFANLRSGGLLTLDRFADGQGPRRSYLSPDGLADLLARILTEQKMQGVFNAAAPQATAMQEIVTEARAECRWRVAPATALQTVSLNTTGLQSALPGLELIGHPAHLVASARRSGVWP